MISKKALDRDYGNVTLYDKRRRLGMRLSFTHYIITESKFNVRTGFLSIHEESIDLYKIMDFTLKIPLAERIFGCGTIIITSKDKTNPIQMIKSIKHPRKFINKLAELVDAERKKYGVYGRDMIGSSGIMEDFSEE